MSENTKPSVEEENTKQVRYLVLGAIALLFLFTNCTIEVTKSKDLYRMKAMELKYENRSADTSETGNENTAGVSESAGGANGR